MDHYTHPQAPTAPEREASLHPAPIHTAPPSPHRSRPRGHDRADASVPVDVPLPPIPRRTRYPTLRTALLCILLAAGAAAVLVPTVRSAIRESGGVSNGSAGQLLGGILLEGGLPPTDTPLPGGFVGAETDTETDAEVTPAPEETTPAEPTVTEPAVESDTAPSETDTAVTDLEDPPTESDSGTESIPPDTESATDADTETLPAEPPVTETVPVETETNPSVTDPVETDPPETDPPETAPAAPMPDGAFPIVKADLSEPSRSVGYIHSTADRLPPAIPGEGTRLWSTAGTPTVLIVHTHPFEGYHDGSNNWYDPASGPLAQTGSQNDPDGVVALGSRLTRTLREAGVTVIHLRLPIGDGESATATYDRTEEAIRYYCDLYPDIGLVLDLRRSAELTDTGEILQTSGTLDGVSTAQLRLSLNADRETVSVARDIAVAVALRQALWAEEPTISRPVWVKSGGGLAADREDVAVLTIELGSAGNTFEEAARLIDPLGAAIAELIQK